MKSNKIRLFLFVISASLLSCTSDIKVKNSALESVNFKVQNNFLCSEPSFSNYFAFYDNIECYFDYEEGFNCSKKLNKPNLIYFSGFDCTDCREFEASVISDKKIRELLKKNFVITTLYSDDKMELPKEYHIISKPSMDTIKIYGKKCLYYQKTKFNEEISPAFYIINSEGELLGKPYYLNLSIEAFSTYLQKGIKEYNQN